MVLLYLPVAEIKQYGSNIHGIQIHKNTPQGVQQGGKRATSASYACRKLSASASTTEHKHIEAFNGRATIAETAIRTRTAMLFRRSEYRIYMSPGNICAVPWTSWTGSPDQAKAAEGIHPQSKRPETGTITSQAQQGRTARAHVAARRRCETGLCSKDLVNSCNDLPGICVFAIHFPPRLGKFHAVKRCVNVLLHTFIRFATRFQASFVRSTPLYLWYTNCFVLSQKLSSAETGANALDEVILVKPMLAWKQMQTHGRTRFEK